MYGIAPNTTYSYSEGLAFTGFTLVLCWLRLFLDIWYPSYSRPVFKLMMASNQNGVNLSQPLVPIFQGINYGVWSTKMKTLFLSQDLWDLVENGYSEEEVAAETLKDIRKRDAKALFFIQQAVDESIFPRIEAVTRSKEAWDTLRMAYQGLQR
ncbi:hypothetical protein PVK06_049131 [Gossypium arboreum]|uniref:DUF4219 domain-containing protein n=1 Tax=Gossypium arboreum TaxID=29729 RepID=A0ABR0MJR3_GOSAR|nr:hypothetical protein PVK06_049131 [Gossypium arboreum]